MSQQSFLSFDRVKSADIDYMTATADHSVGDRSFAELTDFLLTSERSLGNYVKPWQGLGYEGFKCGSVSVGIRRDGRLVRISGASSGIYFDRVFPYVTNISRLDVQVTVDVGVEVNQFIRERLCELEMWSPKRGRPPEIRVITTSNGGMTVQTGKRQSDRLGRIYNKAVESGDKYFENCARFEVELHKAPSHFAASTLYRMVRRTPGVIALCCHFFTGRGASMPISSEFTSFLGFFGNGRSPERLGDHGRALRWLSDQVRPSVGRLVDAGLRDDVLKALGLDRPC